MSRPLRLAIAAGAVVLLLAGGVLAVRRGRAAMALDVPARPLDVARPEALVTTASLADLPRDLLTVPMFRDLDLVRALRRW